jgi:hypothetical protein
VPFVKDFGLDILFLARVIMGCCGLELFEGVGCKEEDVTDSGEEDDVSAKGKVGDTVCGEFGDTLSRESLDTVCGEFGDTFYGELLDTSVKGVGICGLGGMCCWLDGF